MFDLDGVIIAFDLDNTLLDPTGERYDAVTSAFLSQCDLGLSDDSVREAYERVRRWGSILARLGFANPLHDRGHVEGLAALVLLFATNNDLLSTLRDAVTRRKSFIATLEKLDELARATRRGSPQDRLVAERLMRSALSFQETIELQNTIKTASELPVLLAWSDKYAGIEDAHPVDDVYEMLRFLIQRGATCVVISQGQGKFQRQKIEHLGIGKLLSGCVLITQDARRIAGYEMLDARIDELLAGEGASNELNSLWVYRCLLDAWGFKSPWFYARCLHALYGGRGTFEKRLTTLTTVARNDWSIHPPRFIMIGDRYEKDVRPIIELLGCDVGTTVHLRTGKYNEEFNAADLPDRAHPTHFFDSMSAIQKFLEQELTVASVHAIETPPPIAPDDWFNDDLLDFAERCHLECVRNIASALRATQP